MLISCGLRCQHFLWRWGEYAIRGEGEQEVLKEAHGRVQSTREKEAETEDERIARREEDAG